MDLILATALCFACSSAADDRTVPEFLLEARDGSRHSLYAERPGRRATALAFVEPGEGESAKCSAAIERVVGDGRTQLHDVTWLAISATGGGAPADSDVIKTLARAGVPLLLDPDLIVATGAGVETSGTVLLLDSDFREVFRGPGAAIIEVATDGAAAGVGAFDAALAALRRGTPGAPVEIACSGAVLRDLARPRSVTFFRDVAPIVWRHCAVCHRPGQPGPMPLLRCEDVSGWAAAIAEVTAAGRMPPWFASPRHGRFANERRLTETEKRTLALFAVGGARPGDPKDAPAEPTFTAGGWRIAEPDVVLEIPKRQSIPAEGVLPYRFTLLDPGFAEDQWIQAVDCQPTAPEATHHVLVYVVPAGRDPREALLDPNDAQRIRTLGGWAPGAGVFDLPDGEAILVPKHSKLYFELHYAPNGTATSDRTRIALRRSRAPVKHPVTRDALIKYDISIAPNQPDATFVATRRFDEPRRLIGFTPHMHLRGRSMRFELERSGERRVLLDVPRYDFDWQLTYAPLQPIETLPGDQLVLTATYDNSRGNPRNPAPDQAVEWGDQSWEEMMIGHFEWYDPTAPPPDAAAPGGH